MARNRARLTKAITLGMLRPYLPFAYGAYAAFDFTNDRALWAGVQSQLSQVPGWTFTRASTGYALDLAGNLVSFASGALRRTDRGVLIEGARTNLCLQSQTFDNASWSKSTANINADATTAPDSTSTADRLIDDGLGGEGTFYVSQNFTVSTSTAYTFSIFAKRDGVSWLVLRPTNFTTPANEETFFDLTTGVVGTVGAGHTASISALANGWYRCQITFTTDVADTSGTMRVYGAATGASTTVTKDGTNSVFLWGAQLEAAAFPSSYIPTTTTSVTRAADELAITGVSGIAYPLTLFAEVEAGLNGTISLAPFVLLQIGDGTISNRTALHLYEYATASILVTNGGVSQAGRGVAGVLTSGTIIRLAGRAATDSVKMAKNGTLSTEDTSATMPSALGTVSLSSSALGPVFGYIRRVAIWNSAFTDAQLQTQSS